MGSSRPIESKIEEAYYINLDNRPDRLINVIQAIDNSNLLKRICKRFPGIDGKLLSEQDLYSQITKKGKELLLSDQNRAGYLLTRGAIGLAMTYQKLIQSCNKITIFLEDDIHISKDFDADLPFIKYESPIDAFENKDARLHASVMLPFTNWRNTEIIVQGGIIISKSGNINRIC